MSAHGAAVYPPPSHSNPALRRIIRGLAVLAPLAVPAVMGLVVMFVLR